MCHHTQLVYLWILETEFRSSLLQGKRLSNELSPHTEDSQSLEAPSLSFINPIISIKVDVNLPVAWKGTTHPAHYHWYYRHHRDIAKEEET